MVILKNDCIKTLKYFEESGMINKIYTNKSYESMLYILGLSSRNIETIDFLFKRIISEIHATTCAYIILERPYNFKLNLKLLEFLVYTYDILYKNTTRKMYINILKYASENGFFDIIEFLIKNGMKRRDAVDGEFDSAIAIALKHGNKEIAEYLFNLPESIDDYKSL